MFLVIRYILYLYILLYYIFIIIIIIIIIIVYIIYFLYFHYQYFEKKFFRFGSHQAKYRFINSLFHKINFYFQFVLFFIITLVFRFLKCHKNSTVKHSTLSDLNDMSLWS